VRIEEPPVYIPKSTAAPAGGGVPAGYAAPNQPAPKPYEWTGAVTKELYERWSRWETN